MTDPGAAEPDAVAALVRRCQELAGPAQAEERLEDATELVERARAAGDPEAQLVGRRHRLIALLEGGDVDGADAEIDAYAGVAGALGHPRFSWYVPLWRGMRALLEGRFDECERRNEEAAAAGDLAGGDEAEALTTLQHVALRVAQDRLFEVVARWPDLGPRLGATTVARAWWAGLLGALGRDGEARAELDDLAVDRFAVLPDGTEWLSTAVVLADLAATLGHEQAVVLSDLLGPHGRRFAVAGTGAVCHGSVARPLGRMAHALDRPEAADARFAAALAANEKAGAPLLVAHTQSQWSALLRARDGAGDWEKALHLLEAAEAIYQRLGIDRLADDARSVLARSYEPSASERTARGNRFHRDGGRWVLSFDGHQAEVADSTGMQDLAVLLGNPGRSFHVTDLIAGSYDDGLGSAEGPRRPRGARPTGSPAAAGAPALPEPAFTALGPFGPAPPPGAHWAEPGGPDATPASGPLLDERAQAENRGRLADLEQELARAEAADDPVAAALARAEHDVVAAELAIGPRSTGPAVATSSAAPPPGPGETSPPRPLGTGTGSRGDLDERARRTVGIRIRDSLDTIEAAHPALGRHLRLSVRTGTFCSYEPEHPVRWATGPDVRG